MRFWCFLALWIAAIVPFSSGRAIADVASRVPVEAADAADPYANIAAAASPYVPCLPGSGGDLKTNAKTALLITIDTSERHQTISSFGASDAWSIQFVGQWPAAQREVIADLLFETGLDPYKNPKGIGLSAWRFNLGAGSSRQGSFSDPWHRVDTFLNGSFTGYDWSRCPGQRWFLQAARARGVSRFIAFVNSPPVNMTKNGLPYPLPSSGTTNLRDDKREAFAVYLATILWHFRDSEGIGFAGISPFNEPNWDWSNAGAEANRYSNGDIQQVVVALYEQLQQQQLSTRIEIPEAGEIDFLYGRTPTSGNYIDAFFNRDSPYYVGGQVAYKVVSHAYGTDWPDDGRLVGWRRTLRAKLDKYPGLACGTTEYCILLDSTWVPAKYRGYGHGRDLGIDPALWITRVIHHDLTIAEVSDWQWWLAVSPYDYKDGLVYIDKRENGGPYYESKMLWTLGNFSRFIRPGMVRVGVSRSDNATPEAVVEDLMVSAYWRQEDGTAVVVFVNRAAQNRPIRLDFLGAEVGSLIPYVTRGSSSSTDNLTAYRALSPEDTIAIPARSVVTLVTRPTNLGDWDRDAKVDFRDFAVLAARWSGTGSDPSLGGRQVGFQDLDVLAGQWLADFRLMAHWRLDEMSGAVARDATGHADGSFQGHNRPAWRPGGGKVNGALQFDGVNDYVQTPFVLDPTAGNFSIFAWVQGSAPGQVILSQAGGVNWLMVGPDGTLTTGLNLAGRQGRGSSPAVVLTDGAWHRVGLSWDGATRILYADGTEVARGTQMNLQGFTGGLSIGTGSTMAAGSFWNGLIDDVRIYDRAVKP